MSLPRNAPLATPATATCTLPMRQYGLFVAPDGSEFTLVQVKPSEWVTSAFEERATAKRVAP